MEPNEYYLKKRNVIRFHPDLDTVDEVKLYFRNWAISLLPTKIVWSGTFKLLCGKGAGETDANGQDVCWGVETSWTRPEGSSSDSLVQAGSSAYSISSTEGIKFRRGYSVYVLRTHRGKGHMSRWLSQNAEKTVFTAHSCEIEAYLTRNGAKFLVFPDYRRAPHAFDPEYSLVANFYGDRVTDRTGAHMINHIDEGIWILRKLGASEDAMRAYVIHPLVQGDDELRSFWRTGLVNSLKSPKVMMLALEYRNIANAHLSWHPPQSEVPFKDSPLEEVNHMLIADKVQNRKDFDLFHLGSHPRSDRLEQYFSEWLEKLQVSEERYQALCGELLELTGGAELAQLSKRAVGKAQEVRGETDQLGYQQVFGKL